MQLKGAGKGLTLAGVVTGAPDSSSAIVSEQITDRFVQWTLIIIINTVRLDCDTVHSTGMFGWLVGVWTELTTYRS